MQLCHAGISSAQADGFFWLRIHSPDYNSRMRRDKIEIYVHIIWTVYDRHPLISPELEADLFPIICEIGERHRVKTLGINGTPDHLHWLTKFSSTTRLCDLVKDVKGASSLFANEILGNFKWRPTYAAFSVSRWNTRQIAEYIDHQKEHHAEGTTKSVLESEDEEYEIPDDELGE